MRTVHDEVAASIEIAAPPSEVFPFFIDSDLMVEWMADSAKLDGRAGGELTLLVEGTKIVGRFLEVDAPRRIRFSWGFEGSDSLPPEASEVDVLLSPTVHGTLVELRHVGLGERDAAEHRRGWEYFLKRLGERLVDSPSF